MKNLLTLSLIFVTSCTLNAQTAPEVTTALQQHSIVINAISQYIADLQAKGVLPTPVPVK